VNYTEVMLNDVSGFTHDAVYQIQSQLDHFSIPCLKVKAPKRLELCGPFRRKVLQSWNQRKPFGVFAYLVHEHIDCDTRLLQFKPLGTVYLEGYWQIEKYFKDVEGTIRQDLAIIAPIDSTYLDMAYQISSSSEVALRVSFFYE